MKNNCITGYSIADIHIGGHKPNNLRKELNFFLKTIKEKEADFIFIIGDTFDKKISLNDENGVLAIEFLNTLANYCISNNIFLRIIKGTESHDNNQLLSFKNFEELEHDFSLIKIIDKLEVEEFNFIDDNENEVSYRVLYVPESYPEEPEKFSNQILKILKDENIDKMLYHGSFIFSSFEKDKIESERYIKTSPILDEKKILNSFEGYVHCGHIHSNLSYGERIFYTNSFSRNSFGEEDNKGFLYWEHNYKTNMEKVERITNTLAPIYKTINLSKQKGFVELSIEDKIKYINTLKKKYDNLRIKDFQDTDLNMKIIADNFDKTNVKIELKKEKVEEIDKTFDFILKREYPIEILIQKFLKIKFAIVKEESVIRESITEEN